MGQELERIFVRYGLAMFLCQAIELKIINILCLRYFVEHRPFQDEDKVQKFYSNLRKSYTSQIKKFLASFDVPFETERLLTRCNEYRNFLAHHALRENISFDSQNGTLDIKEIHYEKMMKVFNETLEKLHRFDESQIKTIEVENKIREEELNEFLRKIRWIPRSLKLIDETGLK